MNIIVIDIAEKPYVFKTFDNLGIPYEKEEIRIPKKCEKTPLRFKDGELICTDKVTAQVVLDLEPDKLTKDTLSCESCDHKSLRIGDFTNDKKSFIVERKRVDDFYSSMVDGRLYEQARKMYAWMDGLKIIILEGMGSRTYLEDGFNPFDKIDKEEEREFAKSPLQQLVDMKSDKKDWILGTISDLASCEVALVQSWNLEETALMIKEIADGSGIDPKIRNIPKKISGLSLEAQMLTVIPGIGKGRSQNILAEYGTLSKLITAIRKMKKTEANKRSMTKKLKEVFG